MTMVEKVARALAIDEYADRHGIDLEAERVEGTDHFETFFERSLGSFERPAIAALKALRDPTPEMVEVGQEVPCDDEISGGVIYSTPTEATAVWQAMIDSALSGEREGKGE